MEEILNKKLPVIFLHKIRIKASSLELNVNSIHRTFELKILNSDRDNHVQTIRARILIQYARMKCATRDLLSILNLLVRGLDVIKIILVPSKGNI